MLANTGALYFRMGQYQKALEVYQQTLAIQKADSDRIGSADTLNNIGVVYMNLGNYTQALNSYQQALTTVQDFCYKEKLTCYYGSGAAILNNFSGAYFSLGQYQKSLELAEKSANIYQKFRTGEYKGTNKQDIQLLYDALGQNPQALQQITSRAVVGDAFGKDSFQYEKALGFYQQALAIHREVSDKVSETATLKYLGDVLAKQNQPQLAIAFYKQSVNLTETIRQSLRVVPTDIQQSYTETIAERYRRLVM
ncbi:MAG: tetratricopeptide repeat protein [Aulosira sp. DedQUE10]|nr:tetratricopeptide repeat protein [Aulosira sp. DedQUE10]